MFSYACRFRKLYARNRVTVIAGALIVASLVAVIAISISRANLAHTQAAIATEARNAAVAEDLCLTQAFPPPAHAGGSDLLHNP